MRLVHVFSCAFLLLASVARAPVAAQETDPNTPVSSEAPTTAAEPVAQPGGGAAAAVQPGALPERASEPRTLRAYWHVFAAFAITWVLLFGYTLVVGRRFARLEDTVRRLGRAAE